MTKYEIAKVKSLKEELLLVKRLAITYVRRVELIQLELDTIDKPVKKKSKPKSYK